MGWVKGAPNSFGSSCIRVNGTNYKSRAISPHYSAGTQRRRRRGARDCLALQLSVGDGGKEEKSRAGEISYMENRYEE